MNKRVTNKGRLIKVAINSKVIKCQEHDSIDLNTGNTFNSHSWIAQSIMDVLNK